MFYAHIQERFAGFVVHCLKEAEKLRKPACPFPVWEDITECELLDKFEKMNVLRTCVETIDPSTTVVATFIPVLDEAIKHYRAHCTTLPDFLLADWEGGENDLPCREHMQNNGITVLPVSQCHNLGERRLCLYSRPQSAYWEYPGYQPLVNALAWRGISEGYMVDAAVYKAIWSYSPRPSFVQERLRDIRTVYNALADEGSREAFLRVLKCLQTGDPGYLRVARYNQYVHPLVKAEPGDHVIEGGIANGLSTHAFAEQVGACGHVLAFEPVSRLHAASSKYCNDLNHIEIRQQALWSHETELFLEDKGPATKTCATNSDNYVAVQAVSLDSVLLGSHDVCDLIKLDIEGAEMQCLKGAKTTLRRCRPKLQISLYHDIDHYLDIPLFIMGENLGYKLYMCHHAPFYEKTCLYAMPPQKIKIDSSDLHCNCKTENQYTRKLSIKKLIKYLVPPFFIDIYKLLKQQFN